MQSQYSAEFINAVSSYAISIASALSLILTLMITNHKKYWEFVYLMGIMVGFSSAYYHFSGLSFLGYALDATNISIMLTIAVYAFLRDYGKRHRPVTASMFLLNLNIFIWILTCGPDELNYRFMSVARYSDFSLFINGIIFTLVIYSGWRQMTENAKRMVIVLTLTFVTAIMLWMPQNDEVGFGFLLYHSAWHITMAMGIFLLWAFNQMRYEEGVAIFPEAPGSVPWQAPWGGKG